MRNRRSSGPAVLFGKVFWPRQVTDGVTIYVPGTARWMVGELDGTLHAVPVGLTPTRRRTVDTICGIEQAARPLLVDDGPGRVFVPIWPPTPRAGRHVRCLDCVAFTGLSKPHPMWTGLTLEPEAVPA